MWSGTIATIPAGWQLCDGTNGTPDLRDRFIVCARQDDAGVAKTNVEWFLMQTGGAVNHFHNIGPGPDLAAGNDYGTETDMAYNCPPYFALAYIQKM